ncbi:MAG: hypothetical protein AB7K24_25745 [Gemmataceae bacterium]
MARSLDELRELLDQGRLQSGSSSLDRKAPTRGSKPILFEVQTALRAYTRAHPDDEAGWRLQSQAEEILTNFTMAIHCLERAMELSRRRDKRDLKNLARLRVQSVELKRKLARRGQS